MDGHLLIGALAGAGVSAGIHGIHGSEAFGDGTLHTIGLHGEWDQDGSMEDLFTMDHVEVSDDSSVDVALKDMVLHADVVTLDMPEEVSDSQAEWHAFVEVDSK